MGFPPPVVRQMTFWEFEHAYVAWAVANGNDVSHEPTSEQLAEMDAYLASLPDKMA